MKSVFFYKFALIFSGFLLLRNLSGNWKPALLLLVLSVAAYASSGWLSAYSTVDVRKKIALSAVPTVFLMIVALNMSGWIGTLSGSNEFSEQFILFFAAPFYLLSIAAYFCDVVLGRLKQAKFIDYLLYVALPFKLLAGPLEPPVLLKQIEKLELRTRTKYLLVAWPWVVLGAFMKFVIANRLNPAANLMALDPISVLITGAVFELKFYFDFAGYSFMAYGLALATGLKITLNFSHPFFARNVVLFWRRWHISLGRFLSRYILEPNLKHLKTRNSKEYLAAGIFLVSAMWHGGTINYVLWGSFHAACYYGYIKFIKHRNVSRIIGVISMLLFFVFGRVLATDPDTQRLLEKLIGFFDSNYFRIIAYQGNPQELRAITLSILFLILEFISLKKYAFIHPYHLYRKPIISFVMMCVLFFYAYTSENLLYARI